MNSSNDKKKEYEEEIVKKYMYVIRYTANRFYNKYNVKRTILEEDDLMQEGAIALLINIRKERFLNTKFVKMISKNFMIDSLRKKTKRLKNNLVFFSFEQFEDKFLNNEMNSFWSSRLKHIGFNKSIIDRFGESFIDDIERKIIMKAAEEFVNTRKNFNSNEKLSFRLRFIEGWTFKEIADFIGMAESSVYEMIKKLTNYILKALL